MPRVCLYALRIVVLIGATIILAEAEQSSSSAEEGLKLMRRELSEMKDSAFKEEKEAYDKWTKEVLQEPLDLKKGSHGIADKQKKKKMVQGVKPMKKLAHGVFPALNRMKKGFEQKKEARRVLDEQKRDVAVEVGGMPHVQKAMPEQKESVSWAAQKKARQVLKLRMDAQTFEEQVNSQVLAKKCAKLETEMRASKFHGPQKMAWLAKQAWFEALAEKCKQAGHLKKDAVRPAEQETVVV